MSDQYIGEIRMFGGNFAPDGWLPCDGRNLPISGYEPLFTLIGTTYGGNGQTDFALPDLRGRVPIGQGQGPSLSDRVLAQQLGVESVALTAPQVPHTHTLQATTAAATTPTPGNTVLLAQSTGTNMLYSANTSSLVGLHPASVTISTGGQPHENRMPLLCVMFIIAFSGIFPSQQ